MFIAVAQVEILSSHRLSEQLKWSYFVNWNWGHNFSQKKKNQTKFFCLLANLMIFWIFSQLGSSIM